jgi:hypothetical protein
MMLFQHDHTTPMNGVRRVNDALQWSMSNVVREFVTVVTQSHDLISSAAQRVLFEKEHGVIV